MTKVNEIEPQKNPVFSLSNNQCNIMLKEILGVGGKKGN